MDETDIYVDVHRRTMVARAKLAYQRQSVSADQGRSKDRLLGLQQRTRSWSANVPHSPEPPEDGLLERNVSVEAEIEVSRVADELVHL